MAGTHDVWPSACVGKGLATDGLLELRSPSAFLFCFWWFPEMMTYDNMMTVLYFLLRLLGLFIVYGPRSRLR